MTKSITINLDNSIINYNDNFIILSTNLPYPYNNRILHINGVINNNNEDNMFNKENEDNKIVYNINFCNKFSDKNDYIDHFNQCNISNINDNKIQINLLQDSNIIEIININNSKPELINYKNIDCLINFKYNMDLIEFEASDIELQLNKLSDNINTLEILDIKKLKIPKYLDLFSINSLILKNLDLYNINVTYMDNLEYLDCSYNNLIMLCELNETLPNSLKNINCSYNELLNLPRILPFNLEKINFSNNKIYDLPDLSYSTKISNIICNNNKLTELNELYKLDNIKKLECSNNFINENTILKILQQFSDLKLSDSLNNKLNF